MRGAYEQVSYRKLHNYQQNKSKKRKVNFIVNHKSNTYFPLAGKENCKFRTNYCSKIITGCIFPQYHKKLRICECCLVGFVTKRNSPPPNSELD